MEVPFKRSIYFKSQLEKEDYFYNGRLQDNQLLENLTSYDLRILIRTEDELACCSGFTRIFPSENYTRWPQLFFSSSIYRPFSDCLISLTLICTGENMYLCIFFIYINFSWGKYIIQTCFSNRLLAAWLNLEAGERKHILRCLSSKGQHLLP